ncbi:methyltransferase [Sphingomonas sp. G-3-2-10]|uniref:class I SAM-dependent methyltransferase n=1 Tax=Sphingomonas sp. G-3-2-10 TaxID=2728838 RepID=UPI0032171AE7
MTRWKPALLAAAMCLAAPAFAQTAADYGAAVAAQDRPADQVKLDAGRHPAEVLAFLGLKRGMTAADIMAGAGYYSEIMAHVVGPNGKVIAYEPEQFYGDKAKPVWAAVIGRVPNVALTPYPFDAFGAPAASLDFTLLHLVYHDLYWESAQYKIPRTDPAAFLRALFAATKPGGIVGVIDHVGLPGDTRVTVDKLHRIDPAVLVADFKAAGFVLEAESPVLRVAGDDHTKLVFDPAVRGNTDRVVYRFRKPK